jgi:NDP-sugar pyrophosphorylase family protein
LSEPGFPTTLILAGGFATRLGALTRETPKAMISVAGEPFIAHQLRLLAREGTERAIILTHYLSRQIEEFVGDGKGFGLSVSYSEDGDMPLGTGGAVKKCLPLVEDSFAVIYGDTFLDISFPPIFDYFRNCGKAGLMTVLDNGDQWDKSNVLFRNGCVEVYDKVVRDPSMHHIDYGLSIFKREAYLTHATKESFDLSEIFQALIREKQLAGFEVTKRFYEIGTAAGIADTEQYLKQQGYCK